ncbi:hypothetical protein D3C71_1747630 [compost metagenome]
MNIHPMRRQVLAAGAAFAAATVDGAERGPLRLVILFCRVGDRPHCAADAGAAWPRWPLGAVVDNRAVANCPLGMGYVEPTAERPDSPRDEFDNLPVATNRHSFD